MENLIPVPRPELASPTCPHGLASRVLPERVEVVEASPSDYSRFLYPSEDEALRAAAPVRRYEFSTGRVAARLALSRLGQSPVPIARRADRSPVWPDGFVGSLSHTRGHCAAAVGRSTDYSSIGLDVEVQTRLDDSTIELICTTQELATMSGSAREAARIALLLFSAKECFYKCQFPLTRRMLGFHDVVVDLDGAARAFSVRPLTAVPELAEAGPFVGCFEECCGLIATGIVLPI